MIRFTQLFRALLLVLLAGAASAHDVGVVKLRFEELGDSRYLLRYTAPPGSPQSMALPVLPSNGAWEEEPAMPSGIVHLYFTTTDGAPLQSADRLRLPWNIPGVMVESFWRSGETARHYFIAGKNGIEIPISGLRSGASSFADAAGRYTRLGAEHILTGWDHLLFIGCLLMLVRGVRRIIITITAFTLSHSLMLALTTYGWSPLGPEVVEPLIALSIALLAADALRGSQGNLTTRPAVAAFTFGLLHGMGLANAIADLELPRQEIPIALGFFNLGVEIGQLAFVLPVLAAAALLHRASPDAGRRLIPAAATVIGVTAMFWFIDRTLGIFS